MSRQAIIYMMGYFIGFISGALCLYFARRSDELITGLSFVVAYAVFLVGSFIAQRINDRRPA